MRRRRAYLVAAFDRTTDAMEVERVCGTAGVPGRLIPLPPAIDAGCGLAWASAPSEADALSAALSGAGIRPRALRIVELWDYGRGTL